MCLEKLAQSTIVTSLVHLQKVVHWTSVPGKLGKMGLVYMENRTRVRGKTGIIHYCTNANKSGAHATSCTLY